MPEGNEDIAQLSHSWLTGERQAQGRLFGKCHVNAKYHATHLEELPPEEAAGFMADMQLAGRILRQVTGAVKINFEIHANSGPHMHCHFFPRYLDDGFPSAPIDYRLMEPSPYENEEEYRWFLQKMREGLASYL